MRSKDELIEYMSKLLLDLLKIGQDRLQEITNLLCEIEKLPKDQIITHTAKLANVIAVKDYIICPRCKENEKSILKSGKRAPYCKACNAERTRIFRKNKKLESISNNL